MWLDSLSKKERMKTTFKSEGHFNEALSDESEMSEIEWLWQENQDLRSLLEEKSEFSSLQKLFEEIQTSITRNSTRFPEISSVHIKRANAIFGTTPSNTRLQSFKTHFDNETKQFIDVC